MSIRGANSIASTLPTCRIVLLLGGVLLISESVSLATTMFAASALTFLGSVVLGAKIYRAAAQAAEGPNEPASGQVDGAARS